MRPVPPPASRGGSRGAIRTRIRRHARRSNVATRTNRHIYRIDDAVFICEQQFMATLIQVPRAIDRGWFGQLTLSNFMTPVFRSLFQAIAAAGGLPSDDTPQGLWMHNLTRPAARCWNR